INQAAIEAIRLNLTKYTHSLGLAELRTAISRSINDEYGVVVDPEQIIVTTGTSAGMLLTFAALLNPGEEVILSDPGYPCYSKFVDVVGGKPVYIQLNEQEGWKPSVSQIESVLTAKTKCIVVNSPMNPTGTIMSKTFLAKVAELSGPDQIVISNEIYHGMVYEGQAHSILEFTDQAIVINGFSKLHAMTGWRLGYLVVPPQLVRPIQKLQQNLYISAPTISQYAALAALDKAKPDIERMVALYDERRQWLVPCLKEMGFGIPVDPTGAFYVLADARHLSENSYDLALEILAKAKVALTPGIDFGENAEGHIRFSYATSLEEIKEACHRLREWLANR
ncbi:MAG: pyridoxal phosphate-dependent aminotransferase, partial [Actinomycetia bacterium]|nr:pyridoxal phosphate-dependent aminotransferase [Actinomycetes bacterium]